MDSVSECGQRFVGASLVVVIGNGFPFPESVHVATGLPRKPGAAEGRAEVLSFVAWDGRSTGFHTGPKNDGQKTVSSVVILRSPMTIGTYGTPRRVAHGSEDADAPFECGEAAGPDRVLGIGPVDRLYELVVADALRAVLLELFAGRLGGFAEVNMRIDASKGNVGGIGKLNTISGFGSEIDFEGFAFGTVNLACGDFA